MSERLTSQKRTVEAKRQESKAAIEAARQLMEKGDWQKSLTHFKKGISLEEEQSARVYHEIGNLLVKLGERSEAIVYYEKALNSNPSYPHILYLKIGDAFKSNRQFDNAIYAYKKSIQIKNDGSQPYEKIAALMAKQARLKEAIQYQEIAVKIAPKNERSRFSLINLCKRYQNQSSLEKYNYQVISLGLDCLSRTLPTRWGIKKVKSQGEVSMPFDLSVHPYSSICELIENNFRNYLNPSCLKVFTSKYKNISWIENSQYHCSFNHEQGNYWSENKFKNFIERYQTRIQNFYNTIAQGNILFILHISKGSVEISRLLSIIESKFTNLFFKLVVIDTRIQKKSIKVVNSLASSNLVTFQVAIPYEGYRWSYPTHYQSPAGLLFEENISNCIIEVIQENFPKKSNIKNC